LFTGLVLEKEVKVMHHGRNKGSRSHRKKINSRRGASPTTAGKGRKYQRKHAPKGITEAVSKTTTKAVSADSAICYSTLSYPQDSDGECSKCRKYPNPVVERKTDEGIKKVVVCQKCGHIMKPH
jgi:hypothetical protein